MISNTKKALMAALWISEECPGCMPEVWGNSEMGSLQLVLDIDEVGSYEKIVIGLGVGFAEQLVLWLAEVEKYESAAKVVRAIEHIKVL